MAPAQDSTFGDLLRRLRSEAGLTQEKLAERAGLSVRGISDLERGINRWPYRATIRRLIEALARSSADVEELWNRASRRRGPQPRQQPDILPRLPAAPTPILGREREEAMVFHLLRWEGKRLITLTGAGGVGKTRLALEVARIAKEEYADGATFVSLASISDPTILPATVATALAVRVSGGAEVEDALRSFLADRELLLVLDNFEQIQPAAPFLAELLSDCPRLKVVVTSREPLCLRGEQEVEIGPLAIPAEGRVWSPEDLGRIASVALLLQRVASVQPAFALTGENSGTVAEICRRLDGLPLALELAAIQLKYQSPQRLLAQLSHRLAVLTGGARDLPPRQQTMRDTIAWSYRLLGSHEQLVFRHLAAFSGGCTEEAVWWVVDAADMTKLELPAVLHGLVDKNLLRAEVDGETRFVMLETIREYALEQLTAHGEADEAHRKHAHGFLELTERAELL